MRPSVAIPVQGPAAAPLAPTLPSWVRGVLGRCEGVERGDVTITEAGDLALVSAALPAARSLSPDRLREAVADLYARAGDALRCTRAPHLVRVWNFIPGIHEPLGTGHTRYFVFNQARFDAFTRWLGGASAFEAGLPTATGIGHDGDELALHFLGCAVPGRPLENPRQQPAYRYSTRHGPRPPCFARATRVHLPFGESLLVGGTAAVRGEESVHPGLLSEQLDETFLNLESLLSAAGAASLHGLTHARIYYLRPEDRPALQPITARFHPACDLEFVRAEICRRELLVEIEGLARLPGGTP